MSNKSLRNSKITSAQRAASGVLANHYEPAVFMKQFPLVKHFVEHLIFYRVLKKAYEESELKSVFWTQTINAHVSQATIFWCMVFGAKGCNPTHWVCLSLDNPQIQHDFTDELCKNSDMNRSQWSQYWDEMIGFRNGYIAHRHLDFGKPVPNFDVALTVVHHYDQWIRKVIKPDKFEELLLRIFQSELMQSTKLLADRLLKATNADESSQEVSGPRGQNVEVE